MAAEFDPLLRRLERNALVACGLMVVAALVWRGGHLDAAAAVATGGMLAGISYRGIKGGIDAAVAPGGDGSESAGGWRRGAALVKFFTRYAIVALAAYIGMARLHLHPVGVVAGASSFVMAAAVEAIRSARPSRPGNPR